MKRFVFCLVLLLLLVSTTAGAWETTLTRPTSAGPFPVTIQNLGNGLTHYTIGPEGNYGDKCLDLTFDTRLWTIGVVIEEGTVGTDSWIKITISVPIPFTGKYLCCDMSGQTVNQKLATCGGTKSCCGETCDNCCAVVTVDKCYISDNSDCS